jgi:hypothetical protein
VRLFRRARPALHTIGEAEAYARCHGERSDEIVSVERLPTPPPAPARRRSPRGLSGESLRQAFEARLSSRGERSA